MAAVFVAATARPDRHDAGALVELPSVSATLAANLAAAVQLGKSRPQRYRTVGFGKWFRRRATPGRRRASGISSVSLKSCEYRTHVVGHSAQHGYRWTEASDPNVTEDLCSKVNVRVWSSSTYLYAQYLVTGFG